MTHGPHRPRARSRRSACPGQAESGSTRAGWVDLAMTGPWPEVAEPAARWEASHADDLADWFTACESARWLPGSGPRSWRMRSSARRDLGADPGSRAGRPAAPAVATVNAYAAHGALVPQLGATGRRWSARPWRRAGHDRAGRGGKLDADPRTNRLRECASSDCPRVFYDTSRPGTRRWCDPVRCGDRQRCPTVPTNPATTPRPT